MAQKKRRKSKKNQPEEKLPAASGISSRYRFFLWMCGFFALATVFLRLDVITVWPGAEATALKAALSPELDGFYLPSWINTYLSGLGPDFYLAPRLFSALCLIGTAMLFFHWGRRIFGMEATRLTLILAAAGLWLPFFGKVATADSWALLGHTGLFLSALLWQRDGRKKYAYFFLLFTLLSALAAPVSSLIFLIGFSLFAYRAKNIERSNEFGGAAIGLATAVLLLTQPADGVTYYFLGDLNFISYRNFLFYGFLGVLPQVGWWLAGQRDWFFRLKKQDELAKSLLPFVVMALMAQSLLLMLLWSLLSAKQMQNYFAERYPWKSWVRAGAVLHLIFAFFAAFLGLMAGLAAFRGDGYRAALGMVAAYWIFSLLAVIGLYGLKRDFSIGGTALAGLLLTLFFWTQVYPYLETQRNWPQQVIEAIQPEPGDTYQLLFTDGYEDAAGIAIPYFKQAGLSIDPDSHTANHQILVRPIENRDTVPQPDQIYGRIVIRGIIVDY